MTPPTWAGVIDTTTAELVVAGIERADAEARWIVEHVSGLDTGGLIGSGDRAAPAGAVSRIHELVARRSVGEPLQYVLGVWPFREFELLVDRRVLIPRPETETVAEVAIEEAERLGARRGRPEPWAGSVTSYSVADLGTGTGALALALAGSLPDAEVWAADVSPGALAVARANLSGAGLPATRIRVAEGSWFDALPDDRRGALRVVVSNPPYIAESEVTALPESVVAWEPRDALVSGPTGLEAIAEIVAAAPEWLDSEGTLVCELAPHQAEAAVQLARDAGFPRVEVRPDLAGRDRMIVARRTA